MEDVVIVSGVRTPVGTFGGSLKTTPVVQLGALVLKETLKKVSLRPVATDALTQFEPDSLKGIGMIDLEKEGYDYNDSFQPIQIDEVIMGNVVGAGQGQNVARQAAINAGIPSASRRPRIMYASIAVVFVAIVSIIFLFYHYLFISEFNLNFFISIF